MFVDRAKQTLEPLQDALKRYEEQVHALETAQQRQYGGLEEQLRHLLSSEQQLMRETGNLVNALRRPQVRGRWGEMTLRRVVELAGLSQYCDFQEQVSVTTESGRLRPDLVVRLPAGRTVVVDAKCSLEAYLSAVEAPDEGAAEDLSLAALSAIARAYERAGAEELLGSVRLGPGFRGDVRAGGVVSRGGDG